MLLFIVLALLVALTKSLILLLVTEVGFMVAVAIAIAGPLSYLCRPTGTIGMNCDRSRRGASVSEVHFELTDHLQQGIAERPARRPMAGSSLVRRLVCAKDDPAKQRIRAQLSAIDDERLFGLGLTSEDIAALRGTANSPAEATLSISPPIAGHLDATDDVQRHESDTPRRQHVSHVVSG